jgi:hypothetical protein
VRDTRVEGRRRVRVEIRDHKGVVGVVQLRDGVAIADERAANILDHMVIVKPGEPRTRLMPGDGEEYLEALQHNLRGTYLWATAPLE